MHRRHSRVLAGLAAAAFATAACEGGSTGTGAPRLSIKLTDAPGDLSEAWVEVEQVYLQGSGGRVVLRDASTGLVDLLTLRHSVADLVNEAAVPAGSYSELRFVIGDAYVRTRSGQVYATQGATLPSGVTATGRLNCPSCAQSGLKVKLPGGGITLEDEAKVMVVDFDVSQSFGRPAGNSGQWVMHPVLRATDLQASATIAGTVALAQGVTLPATCGGGTTSLTQFVPRARTGADTAGSGSVDANGAYRIRYLAPGGYTLEAAPATVFANGDSLVFTATAQPMGVTVGSGATATAHYSVTAVRCQ